MKKAGIAVASVLLAGTLIACTACGDSVADTGIVKGNFTEEATAEQLGTAIESIDTETAFGDRTAEDWKLGLQISANLEAKTSTSVTVGNETAKSESTYAISGNLDFSIDQALSILANGSFKMTSKAVTGGETESSETKVNTYMDADYLYLDLTVDGNNVKTKYSIADAMEGVGGMLPISAAETDFDIEEVEGGLDLDFDIAEILADLADMGGKVYLDESDGLKMKVSFGKESVIAFLEEMTEFASYAELAEFDSCVLDFYLVFDKDGKFVQFSFNTNISAKIEVSPMTMEFSVKGGAVVKTSTAAVTLPSGLATDSSYVVDTF